jgi:hypothetical protein
MPNTFTAVVRWACIMLPADNTNPAQQAKVLVPANRQPC